MMQKCNQLGILREWRRKRCSYKFQKLIYPNGLSTLPEKKQKNKSPSTPKQFLGTEVAWSGKECLLAQLWDPRRQWWSLTICSSEQPTKPTAGWWESPRRNGTQHSGTLGRGQSPLDKCSLPQSCHHHREGKQLRKTEKLGIKVLSLSIVISGATELLFT